MGVWETAGCVIMERPEELLLCRRVRQEALKQTQRSLEAFKCLVEPGHDCSVKQSPPHKLMILAMD